MKKSILSFIAAQALLTGMALAEPAQLNVTVTGIEIGKPIPEKFAYCTPDGKGKSKSAANINPAISWSGAPAGTKSYAIIVVDKDVPATFELANQDGKTIPNDFPRQNFSHWVLVDVPADVTSIKEGQDSSGTPEGGKKTGKTAYGVSGTNDYAKVYRGSFGGYDGPCPPWNDERLHHYHFIVYALGISNLEPQDVLNGPRVEDLLKPHVLARGEVMGTYTQNPGVMSK